MEVGNFRKGLENTIQYLEKIRSEITEENEHNFEIESKIERPLNTLYLGFKPIGFEQKGPVIFQLTIKDSRNQGKLIE